MKLSQYKSQVRTFVKVCHRLANNLYVTGYSGNLAWKLDSNVALITPTQMNKGDIQAEDVVLVNLAGEILAGERRPTGELPMYLKFFKERSDIVSIIHCHPPAVCALTITDGKNYLMRPIFTDTAAEIGPAPIVPYAPPLTEELAESFNPYLQKYNSFLIENHGLVTMSRGDIYWTLMNVELLETTTQSIILALQTGGGIKELGRETVKHLGEVMWKRNLPLFGAPGVNKSLESLYFED